MQDSYPGDAQVFKAPLAHGYEMWVIIPTNVRDEHADAVGRAIRVRMREVLDSFDKNFPSEES
jgi:hypothetical protein